MKKKINFKCYTSISMNLDKVKIQKIPIFIGLILLASALRLFALWLFPIVERDGILYLQLIETWHREGSYQNMLTVFPGRDWIPSLPLFLMKLFMPLGVSAECSARILSIFCGSFVPIIGYEIAWTLLKDQKIAISSGVLFAVHPILIEYSIQPLRDGFYIFWCGLSLLFLCRGVVEKKWYDWSLAGLFFSSSLLTRYETLELLPLVILFFFWAAAFRHYPWKIAFLHLGLFIACLIISLILWGLLQGTLALFSKSYWNYYLGKWRVLEQIWNI